MSETEPTDPIESYSTEFQADGHLIQLTVNITRTTTDCVPKIALSGELSIDGAEPEQVPIIPKGPHQLGALLPDNNPWMTEQEIEKHKLQATSGNSPMITLEVPAEFYSRVAQAYGEASSELYETVLGEIEALDCSVHKDKEWIKYDDELLIIDGQLQTQVGTFPLRYQIDTDMDIEWSLDADCDIPDKYQETLHAAALFKAPISATADMEDRILSNTKKVSREHGVTAIPLCQAKNCEKDAQFAIPSADGHPHDEWKLCEEHFNETDGQDPYQLPNKGWTLRKLYYRCKACNEQISHNVNLGSHRCSPHN